MMEVETSWTSCSLMLSKADTGGDVLELWSRHNAQNDFVPYHCEDVKKAAIQPTCCHSRLDIRLTECCNCLLVPQGDSIEPECRISRKHGRQTGTARCERCPGREVCLSIQRVQKNFSTLPAVVLPTEVVKRCRTYTFSNIPECLPVKGNRFQFCCQLIHT